MSIKMTLCVRCDGTKVGYEWPQVPLVDGQPVLGRYAETTVAWEREECRHCHGIKGPDGITYAKYDYPSSPYGTAYKSVSALKGAITRGKAVMCKNCQGLGEAAKLSVEVQCYTCSGSGESVESFLPGDVVPDHVNLHDYVTTLKPWADAVEIVPIAGEQTWGESFLGVDSVTSITDYGRLVQLGSDAMHAAKRAGADADAAVTAGKDAMVAYVRGELGKEGRRQLLPYVDSTTREVSPRVVLKIGRNGWSVKSQASLDIGTRGLPPTYTDAVLNAPLS